MRAQECKCEHRCNCKCSANLFLERDGQDVQVYDGSVGTVPSRKQSNMIADFLPNGFMLIRAYIDS